MFESEEWQEPLSSLVATPRSSTSRQGALVPSFRNFPEYLVPLAASRNSITRMLARQAMHTLVINEKEATDL